MFFHIGNSAQFNYPHHWQLGSFFVSTDSGWQLAKNGKVEILYKGYADLAPINMLFDQLVNQTTPELTGNFCALVLIDNTIEIKTDRYRSFPIYIGNGVNNLVPQNQTAWTDSLITVHTDLTVTESKFDVVGEVDTSPISVEDAITAITEIIDNKTQQFLSHNTLPIRVFLSGGVDSMLVYSFLKKHTSNFEMVKCSHVDYDYFWMKNSGDISKNWGYKQIHHWTTPCVLTSGTPGDEYMLRSPTTANQWLRLHGIQVVDLLEQAEWHDCLHSAYFRKKDNYEIFKQPATATPWDLCNIIVNDWQHWHLGNTLTWTPLRDLEIFKLLLRLPMDAAVEQVMNSKLSIQLIEQNCPGLSAGLSTQKNSGNVLSNLTRIYE
jgi:hypothetical protein